MTGSIPLIGESSDALQRVADSAHIQRYRWVIVPALHHEVPASFRQLVEEAQTMPRWKLRKDYSILFLNDSRYLVVNSILDFVICLSIEL